VKEMAEENIKKKILQQLSGLVDPKTGIVRALIETAKFNDEPKLFTFTALWCQTSHFSDGFDTGCTFPACQCGASCTEMSGGASMDRDMAMIRTLGEAMERYCCAIYRENNFFISSYQDIENEALDPRRVAGFSETQLSDENLRNYLFDENSKFNNR
jgi:ribosomal protein S12 methylthiotransferase accessory factor